jgi:hypothetical protein
MAAHPTASFQCCPGACPNRLLHTCTWIARGFDEEAYGANADALANQFVELNAADDDLATTRPWRYGITQNTTDLFQHFGLNQGELTTTILA